MCCTPASACSIARSAGAARRAKRRSEDRVVDPWRYARKGTKLVLYAPLEKQRKGEHRELLADARGRGFSRLRIDGKVVTLDDSVVALDKKAKHDLDLVVDRIVNVDNGAPPRASRIRWSKGCARARA